MRCKAPSLLLPLLAPETCQVIQQKAKGKKREIDISYCIRTTVFNDISSDDSQEKNTIPILEEEEQRVVQGQTPSPRSCAPLLLCQQEQRTRRRKRSRHLFRFFLFVCCFALSLWNGTTKAKAGPSTDTPSLILPLILLFRLLRLFWVDDGPRWAASYPSILSNNCYLLCTTKS